MSDVPLSDPVAKGCTRPAMKFGVPILPLMTVIAVVVWIATVTHILFVVLLVPLVLAMGQVTRTDDQAYRLLGLKLLFRMQDANRAFWRSTTYSPFAFARHRQ